MHKGTNVFSEDSNFCLVTGAAGFIGSRLTQTLLTQGRRVIAVDCFLADSYPPKIKINRWNSLEMEESDQLVKLELDLRTDNFARLGDFSIDSIFNLAAMPGLSSDWGKFAPYYDCNISALNRLLEYARTLELKSFVHASTSSVYGKSAIGMENQDLKPTSPYGVSKLAAEKLLLAYLEWFSTPVKILRYFSVYGPFQRPDMAYSKIINCISQHKQFSIHGDGTQRRSNTYIDDVVEATILAESQAVPGDVMNICGNETISLNEAISLIEEFCGKALVSNRVEGRRGDQRDTSGSNVFAIERLGWKPRVRFREGIEIQVRASLEQGF